MDNIIDGFFFNLSQEYEHFSYGDSILSQYIMSNFDEETREQYITQNLRVMNKSHYAIPINVNNSHWIVACIRLDLNIYYILDTQQSLSLIHI